jgi:hypothetical protein
MDNKTGNLTERMVISVSPKQKEDLHDRAKAAGLGIGEYLRGILFPETAQAGLDALLDRVQGLERRVKELETLTGKEQDHEDE